MGTKVLLVSKFKRCSNFLNIEPEATKHKNYPLSFSPSFAKIKVEIVMLISSKEEFFDEKSKRASFGLSVAMAISQCRSVHPGFTTR